MTSSGVTGGLIQGGKFDEGGTHDTVKHILANTQKKC